MTKTAILVDGAFYRKRAAYLRGEKTPKERADELYAYCMEHIRDTKAKHEFHEDRSLYRIFYYDCPPIKKTVYHPLKKKGINLGQSETFTWTTDFLNELKHKRKVALRMGVIADSDAHYVLSADATKRLFLGKLSMADITDRDFSIALRQKGVDMKIGIDIASLAYKKQVDQIILIAGDSDFVPAAKLARREGIDFILDPMESTIRDDLFEHIDGLKSCWKKSKVKTKRQDAEKKLQTV